jgi:NAD+ synthase
MLKASALDLALDYYRVEKEILDFITRTVAGAKAKGVVLGLSGGIDSSVVGALCVAALGRSKVVGVLMPVSHTPKEDMADARRLCEGWGIKSYEVGIDPIFRSVSAATGLRGLDRVAQANAKARARMVVLYIFANHFGLLVAGTGDRSEDLLGYFTKFGDGGADFLPIAHLYKTQVRALGARLGIPEAIVKKRSSPQLWPGHLATDELPLDYDKLDLVLHFLFDAGMPPEGAAAAAGVDPALVQEVVRMHDLSAHKRAYPPMVRPW